jgi:predicted P-loop ATPase
VGIQHWYAMIKNSKVSKDQIQDAIDSATKACPYHPVRDYLDSLPTGDIAYFTSIASRLWGAAPEDDAIESELFKRQCVAAVRRIREPGVKSDDMLILYGEQGLGKSRFLRALFGDVWFLDHLPTDLHDRDAAAGLRGKWGIEIAELTGWSRANEEARKNFLSRQVDEYRGAYEKSVTLRPRQCVFFGSTNNEQIFSDPTGNRRYSVVHVLQDIDLAAFDRDALWAAANTLESEGYTHFFDRLESSVLSHRKEAHEIGDPWDDAVEAYMGKQKGLGARFVRPQDIIEKAVPIEPAKRTPNDLARARAILRRKCGQSKTFKQGGKVVRAYAIPDYIDVILPTGPQSAFLRSVRGENPKGEEQHN